MSVETNPVSLRDYFAANAPVQPLWNFPVQDLPPEPKVIRSAAQSPTNEPEWDGDINAWRQLRELRKLQQWPFVWADSQMIERERKRT